MEVNIQGIEQLDQVVKALLDFSGGKKKFFLSGDLGAGKTTFVKSFCKYLGIEELVSSPTFSLVNEYHGIGANRQAIKVYHLDLYRLKNEQEALDIGIEDYLYNKDYCFIEWPDIIEAIAPEDVIRIEIELLEDSGRKFLFL
jgi:tRNA threonylcarbamoyladenosine biosynthesis protein TsaE